MNENEFEGFVMPEARMLPVILLLDVSGSMSYDAKMDELNSSVREMLESFQKEHHFKYSSLTQVIISIKDISQVVLVVLGLN